MCTPHLAYLPLLVVFFSPPFLFPLRGLFCFCFVLFSALTCVPSAGRSFSALPSSLRLSECSLVNFPDSFPPQRASLAQDRLTMADVDTAAPPSKVAPDMVRRRGKWTERWAERGTERDENEKENECVGKTGKRSGRWSRATGQGKEEGKRSTLEKAWCVSTPKAEATAPLEQSLLK